MNHSHEPARVHVQVQVRGSTSAGDSDYARAKIAPVVARLRAPVHAVGVKLTQSARPAGSPASAVASVDLNGRPVRAQVTAASMPEAIDLLKDRLTSRLSRITDPQAGTWHRSDPAPNHHGHRVPLRERRIVRRKSVALSPQTPDQAAFDMEALDLDFYLFTDAATGADSLIHRRADGYGMAQLGGAPSGYISPPAIPLTQSPDPVPRIFTAEAVRRIEATAAPHLFFADPTTGRGHVLYHRRDGHYGLITPA
ncbi:sigma 54 modulation/S30EA ribosomal C-terminal domain-containing protein [Streptomyces sp. NPDC020983]|uniref:sigma 54 modulation/S30EA ribosomal C-terminal domain-containing protein n=1 Tax=Streptomyces sp. NPDC020983 TaxID=3365106 RepID=UPI00379FA58F